MISANSVCICSIAVDKFAPDKSLKSNLKGVIAAAILKSKYSNS